MQGTPIGKLSENVDLGTPSAPPFMNIGNVCDSEAGSERGVDNQYDELEQGFSVDKGFAEQSSTQVKAETEVGQRYAESIVFLFILDMFRYLIEVFCRDGEERIGENEHPAPVWHAESVNQMPYYCARLYFSQVLYG